MENVFEELVAGNVANNVSEIEEDQDFDHSYDLSPEDLASPEDDNGVSQEANDEGNETQDVDLSNNAFAQMRTQNKEYSNKISEIESLVQSLGMKDIDEFMAKAKEAQIQKEAKEKGVPIEFAQEIAEIRELKNEFIAERNQSAIEAKEKQFVSNVQEFIKTNSLDNSAVDKLSQDLEKDGLEMEALMSMPKTALNKVLSAYTGSNYQKNLERKETIRKELPINQSSQIDSESLNKEIDALAKVLAGKN